MAITRIVIQPTNGVEADTQYNLLLTKYQRDPQDEKEDPLKEIVFYPFDKEMYSYSNTSSMEEILRFESISLLLPSTESIPEFLLLDSLGLSDKDIRKYFNNE